MRAELNEAFGLLRGCYVELSLAVELQRRIREHHANPLVKQHGLNTRMQKEIARKTRGKKSGPKKSGKATRGCPVTRRFFGRFYSICGI